MRWFTAVLALVFLLVFGVGCAGADRVSNGDRQLAYQNKSAAQGILDRAATLQAALQAMGVPAPAAALMALEFIQKAAGDISANSAQQIKNWGGEERIEKKEDYSEAASAAARKASEEEHARMTKWAVGISIATMVLGWGLKTVGATKIPFLGPVLALLNKGQVQEHNLNQVLQAGIDEARKKYDDLAAALKAKLAGTALEKVGDLIPTGDLLKERLVDELSRKGLLEVNTKIYEANPLIPDDPKEVLVRAEPPPAPAPAS